MIIICAVGMEWETKAQNFLIVTIVAAMLNFLVGSIIGPNKIEQEAQGFVGMSSKFGFLLVFSFYSVIHFTIG